MPETVLVPGLRAVVTAAPGFALGISYPVCDTGKIHTMKCMGGT